MPREAMILMHLSVSEGTNSGKLLISLSERAILKNKNSLKNSMPKTGRKRC